MRISAVPLVVSIALLASPAFAQNTGMNTGPNPASGEYGQSHNQYGSANQQSGNWNGHNRQLGATNPSNAGNRQFAQNRQNEPGVTYDTQQKIRHSLAQNGFRDIRVMPEAFIIRAQAPDGSRVVMEVTPDMVQGVVANTGSSSNNNNNETMNQSQNENGNLQGGSGSSNMGPVHNNNMENNNTPGNQSRMGTGTTGMPNLSR